MLNLIKSISKKHFQASSARTNAIPFLFDLTLFKFSNNKDLSSYKDEAQKRLKSKYTKRHAKKELVEHLYFRDDSVKAIQEELDDFLRKRESNENQDPDAKTQEVPEELVNRVQQLGSTYQNTDSAEYKSEHITPKTKEDISKLVKKIDVNDHLLKIYMKYNKIFGREQIFELFEKLRENLENQETIRKREIEKFNLKVQRMQKMSPQIGIKFRSVFLTKDEIGEHVGFKFLTDAINFKIEKNVYLLSTGIEFYQELMQYKPISKIIMPDFLERVQRQLSKGDIYLHARYLSFLNGIRRDASLELTIKDLISQADNICQSLEKMDLSNIRLHELYLIFNSSKHLNLRIKGDLLFRLEPYVLKEFRANALVDIIRVYLNYGKGTEDFMTMVIGEAMRRLHDLSAKNSLELLVVLCPHTFLKLGYSVNPIEYGQQIFPFIVKHLGAHSYDLGNLNKILDYMLEHSIGDQNVYELISSEFAKLHKEADHKIFSKIYFSLAESGISSNSLYIGFESKLLNLLTEIDSELRQGPVAALQENTDSSEKSKPPLEVSREDLTLKSYEKYESNRFSMALRALWAYSCFAVKEKKTSTLNLKLWDTGLSALNMIIQKAQSFSGIFFIKLIDLELLHQINAFSEMHAKTSARVNIGDLEKTYLCVLGHFMKRPHLIDQKLFNIDKMYFRKKYRKFITKKHFYRGYPIQFEIKNPEIKQSLLFFINEAKDYVRTRSRRNLLSNPEAEKENLKNDQLQEHDEFSPRGHIFMRRYLLEKLKCPYHELELVRMYRFLPFLSKNKELPSFAEQDIQRFMKLPLNLELEPKDQEQVESFEKLLDRVRNNLTSNVGINPGLEIDYNKWLNQNRSSQNAVKDRSDDFDVGYEDGKDDSSIFSDIEDLIDKK